MSRWINTNRLVLNEYSSLMGGALFTQSAQVLAEYDDNEPIAIAVFDQYNGKSIHLHVWIAKGRRVSRTFWWAGHDYLFRQLGVEHVYSPVSSFNRSAIKLVENLGYELISTLPDYYSDGSDCLMYHGTEKMATHWPHLKARATPAIYREEA